jgi:IMP cyclohydrolase
MYVGRIVSVARNRAGRLAVMYRVSSRSFPSREAQLKTGAVAIVPKKGFEGDVFKNPYIAYNCLRVVGATAVATNGSQTDPIAEKIAAGVPVRDAFISAMLALDYEKDQYNTPRISSAVTRGAEGGFLGIVREDGLEVRRLKLAAGECYFVATYETNHVTDTQRGDFDAASAQEGALFILGKGVFADKTNAVTSVCALETADGFELAVAQA